jgi:hypothetical protein
MEETSVAAGSYSQVFQRFLVSSAETGFLQTTFLALLCIILITATGTIVRRLFFHPLTHIPGPLSAAISGWNEFYSNIWLDGQWCKTYPELHRRYSMHLPHG